VLSSKWFLGVDGGQSGTAAVIADESGAIAGAGHAGPCNHVTTEDAREKYRHAISGAVHEAMESAGLTEVTFTAACLGLSGGPADKEALTREIIAADRYLITHDADIALTGALAGKPGLIVIAGTGSIAYGRNAEGKSVRAGGWGYLFGDEGSAFDIVRQALRAILRDEEGWGCATRLREVLLEATGAEDAGVRNANDLLHRFYTPAFPRSRIATFARLVDRTAQEGDEIAIDILHHAAQSLAISAAAVRRQLFDDSETALVSYAGGVFRSRLVLQRFKTLVELDHRNSVQPPVFGPATGALIQAYRSAGIAATPSGAQIEL
jgi:N-acetylglucosamine kinase-like BadF-type ATPase